ncbi:MAG: endonuclease domain-containing protein [Dactylosporangium sp.]|nr:endonuclease domain-containing protein [Dactylosporangium sp.]
MLRDGPFLGSRAVADDLLTNGALRGRCRRLFPDVYAWSDAVVDQLTWCKAALLVAPDGSALRGRSALGMFNRALIPAPDDPAEIVLPAAASMRKHRHLRARNWALRAGDTCHVGGLPSTTPARTGFDLARGADTVDAVIGVDALLNRRATTVKEIAAFSGRAPPGTNRALRALGLASSGAESPMETCTRLLLVCAGLPPPVTQSGAVDDAGFVARLDLAYPECRLGIEYDGDQHRERWAFRRDVARLNRLRACGWTVLRFTAADVLHRPETVVEQVSAILREAPGRWSGRVDGGEQPPVDRDHERLRPVVDP